MNTHTVFTNFRAFFLLLFKMFPSRIRIRKMNADPDLDLKLCLSDSLGFFFLVDIGYSATCRTFRAKQKHFLSLFFYNFVNVLILFLLITYLTNCSVSVGGLGATFYVSYFNTALIFILILLLVVEVSPPEIYLSTPYEQSQHSI